MKRLLVIGGIAISAFILIGVAVSFSNVPKSELTPTPVAETPSPTATPSPASVVKTSAPNPVPVPIKAGFVKVVSIVDGDTIKVSINGETKTVRLIGIDTPEVVDPRSPVQCFGKEASDKAKYILTNKIVRLESDPTQGDLDKYQRLLRYVFLEDGTFFNKIMIEQGYANEYTYNLPYKYQSEFKAAAEAARVGQLGLWNPVTCNGNVSPASGSTPPPTQPTQPSGHTFYLSTYYTAKYYYCDTDPGWQSLSPKYLKSYSSEQELLKNYPSKALHEACK